MTVFVLYIVVNSYICTIINQSVAIYMTTKLYKSIFLACALSLLCSYNAIANGVTSSKAAFGSAKWIAMEADHSILFPHIHHLKPTSERAQALKSYSMPVLSKRCLLRGRGVKRAWVDICGLGQYELFIDGVKQGENFLSPGWTMYNRRLLYNEIDVTDAVKRARNGAIDISVMLGGGMYDIPVQGYHKFAGSCGAPKLLFCLHIEYKDGSSEVVVSDESWRAEKSPVRYTSIFAGEWYDATFRSESQPVVLTKPYWDVPLVEQQRGVGVKIVKELPVVQIAPNLYDTRQNASGIVRIKVKGKRGATISLRPSEVLREGKIYQKTARGYEWKYTLRGDKGVEVWQPQFTYTGFRYLEVVADKDVKIVEITALHTTNESEEVGTFECSDELFNKIHSLIDWAIRSNLVSITTDCPHREKLGWQEQNHLMFNSLMYRYDLLPLFNKIIDDLADSQHTNGAIPTIAPEYVVFKKNSGFEDTPEWGASFVLCPWYIYKWYGDDSAMRKHYAAMKRYMEYLASRTDNYILDYGLGDWFDIGPKKPGRAQLTSVALTATATYYYDLCTMQKIADHLGYKADVAAYKQLAECVKRAFNERFYVGGEAVYEQGSQTGLAMAIYLSLVADENRKAALDALIKDIEKRNYTHTSGEVGFCHVVKTLMQEGRGDILYAMNRSDERPGYAYQLKMGATALTESWQAYDNVSHNHFMLGHLMAWLYGGLGGVRQSHDSVAWDKIVIAPQMVGDVTWAKTSLRTPKGVVACSWRINEDRTRWSVEARVPAGATAEVHLPDGSVCKVGEGNYKFDNRTNKTKL